MEILNILLGMTLVVSLGANMQGAKKGLKTSLTKVAEKPHTYLQSVPTTVSAVILIFIILGIFGVGSFNEKILSDYLYLRISGLIMFAVFSWLQVFSYKSLKENYAQEILIQKNHNLVTNGIYRFIRHPQYLGQILSDLGAGIALMNFIVLPAVILIEAPLFILRAKKEEELLQKHFDDEFVNYKKRSGFFIPFIG
jgi:protein-S-isoprenylcysteine O-methyltransferase Ste14